MSLDYFVRYRFNNENDPGEEDFGERGLAVETGSPSVADDSEYGPALLLNGASLLATGDFEQISGNENRTISFWAKTFAAPAPVVTYGSLTGPYGFTFYATNTAGRPEFYDQTTRHSATRSLSANTWYFFTVTYDALTQQLWVFVDGSNVHSTPVGVLSTGSSESLRIGTDGEGLFFDGLLLDLRVWNTALSAEAVQYMHQRGPNFEEPLDTRYFSNTLRTETLAGSLLCKSNVGVQAAGGVLFDSFYGHDESFGVQEAARVEYSQTSSGQGVATLKIRHPAATGVQLAPTIEVTPEATSFISRETGSDVTSSVVFSSDGVRLVPSSASSEKGCLIFGKGADFRIRVKDGLFTIESYSSLSDSYVTKMEIGG